MEKSLLEQALEYAEHGYWVFPCRERDYGKRLNNKTGKWDLLTPKKPLTFHGFKDASIDEKQIRIWWKQHPQAAIGCACEKSKIFVVDLDTHNEGVNGLDAWHKTGISDEGCHKVMTPSGKGLHIYFYDPNGLGRTNSNEETGMDFRGRGGYVILPNSEIQMPDGSKKRYVALSNMLEKPKELTQDIVEKLGLVRKQKQNRGNYVNNLTLDEELEKAKKVIWKMPFSVVANYDSWLHVGLYLRKFGDAGKQVWFSWSEEKYFSVKPNSKRNGDLEYKWQSIQNKVDDVTLGTLYYYLQAHTDEKTGDLMIDI